MKTNGKPLLIMTLIYIYLPIAIFLVGFTKWWVWFITLTVCAFAIFKMYREYADDDMKEAGPQINFYVLIGAIVFIVLMCVFIGFGGIMWQPGDWPKHNAVLHDLSEKSWPVYYTSHEKSMLTYYLGQYLIPSLIGKITIAAGGKGFNAASTAMAVWAIVGIVLVYCNLVSVTKSNTIFKQIRCLVILFFFCGALPIVQMLTYVLYDEDMYSLGENHWLLFDGFHLQYRSNLVMICWVYPQVIVIWLVMMLLMKHSKGLRHYVILITPILLFGTFSIIVSVAFAVVNACTYLVKTQDKKKTLLQILSWNNIGVFLTLGIVLITYFFGYMQVEKPEFLGFHIQKITLYNIWGVLIFILFMAGIYLIVVAKKQKHNPMYYTCAVALCVIPFFKMGLYNDWIMCASIPALFVLMSFVIEYINDKDESRAYGRGVGIITVMLVVGAIFPADELKDNVKAFFVDSSTGVFDYYGSLERFSDRDSEESKDLIYNYFTYDLDGKTFYEMFAREKIE